MQISIINAEEIEVISKRSKIVNMDYNPQTIDECIAQYNNAEEIANIAKDAIKDGLQGKALLEAKKIICGDEWDAPKLSNTISKKWLEFLEILDLVDKKGNQKVNVKYLLDFAGYKEAGGTIETASHYREVKKITGTTKPKTIDAKYEELGGTENKTVKEIVNKEQTRQVKNKKEEEVEKVYVREEYEKVFGKEQELTYNEMNINSAIIKKLPHVSQKDWKKLYLKLSTILHPDKGGDEKEMAIMSTLNAMMKIIFTHNKEKETRSKWRTDYLEWKKINNINDEIETKFMINNILSKGL